MVIKAIKRNKAITYHVRLNGIAMVFNISIKVIRCKANRNDGHPSCDHGLKCNTSSTNPHWWGLRTGLYPDMSIIFPLWGQLSNDKWCTLSKPLGSPGIDESP